MINKLIIDKENVELTEASTPYYHTFAQAKTHEVKFGLDNTTEVCAYAFEGCKNLTYISLPDKITMIKRGAFKDCSYLPSITLSEHIEYIGKEAFDGCSKLQEIVFEQEDPNKISVFCKIPSNTTCFVPNNRKYKKVDGFDEIDPSGDRQYYTKTDWNEYREVIDPTEIKEEDFSGPNKVDYYVNQWDNIAKGNRLREIKDKVVVSGITLTDMDGNKLVSTAIGENTVFNITYILTPDNVTNTNLYWFSSRPEVTINGNIGTPNVARINIGSVVSTVNTTITAYAESGQKASFTLMVRKS